MQETETTYLTFTSYSPPAPQTFNVLGFFIGWSVCAYSCMFALHSALSGVKRHSWPSLGLPQISQPPDALYYQELPFEALRQTETVATLKSSTAVPPNCMSQKQMLFWG
jgi:hypothetical protein